MYVLFQYVFNTTDRLFRQFFFPEKLNNIN